MSQKNIEKKSYSHIIKKFELILQILIILLVIIFLQNLIIKLNKKDSIEVSQTEEIYEDNLQDENTSLPNNITDEESLTVIDNDITFTMAITGDIMCHNTMYNDAYNSSTKTYNFSYMFEDIKYYLQTADITVGNLETTFAGAEVGYSNYPTFNTPEQLATALKSAGFDVLSTANNHSMDKGYNGLVSTINFLDEANLSHTGTFATEEDSQEILIENVNGVSIAFLSFTYGTNGITIPSDKSYCVNLIDEDLILEQINLAKEQNPDLICVSMHWGTEYQTIQNSTQEKWADFLFENGVDIIIGNHPHVLQPMEKRTITLDDGTTKDVFVVYSLGNFMADQNYSYTRDSAILNLQITKSAETGEISIDSVTYTPIYYYKDTSKSKQKFKIIDIETAIEEYETGADNAISKSLYNTLVTELENIKKILGDEIV